MENKRGVPLTIGHKEYRVWCVYHTTGACKKGMRVSLDTVIYNITDEKYMEWKDIKGTYLEEKVSDYIENSFNGQERIYWSNDWKGRE